MELNYKVKEMSTNDFARLILKRPNIAYTFIIQNDEDTEWYNIVCIKIFDTQSVIIKPSDVFKSEPVIFDLVTYIDGINNTLSEDCMSDVIEGLNGFKEQYRSMKGNWFVIENDKIKMDITHKRLN